MITNKIQIILLGFLIINCISPTDAKEVTSRNLKNVVKEVTPALNSQSFNQKLSPLSNDECHDECHVDEELSFLTPQSALEELNSEELKFMGRDLMPGSGQNRTCIYQNSKIIVLYDNCLSSKKEPTVTDIKIISKFGKGEVSFYIENTHSLPNSTIKRDKYDSTWRISFSSSTAPKSNTLAGVKQYLEFNQNNSDFCFIGESFKAKESAKSICSDSIKINKELWSNESELFWNQPPEEWYATQQKLRKAIVKSSF